MSFNAVAILSVKEILEFSFGTWVKMKPKFILKILIWLKKVEYSEIKMDKNLQKLKPIKNLLYFMYFALSHYIQLTTLFCIYIYYEKIKVEILLEKYSNTRQHIIPRNLIEKIVFWKEYLAKRISF